VQQDKWAREYRERKREARIMADAQNTPAPRMTGGFLVDDTSNLVCLTDMLNGVRVERMCRIDCDPSNEPPVRKPVRTRWGVLNRDRDTRDACSWKQHRDTQFRPVSF